MVPGVKKQKKISNQASSGEEKEINQGFCDELLILKSCGKKGCGVMDKYHYFVLQWLRTIPLFCITVAQGRYHYFVIPLFCITVVQSQIPLFCNTPILYYSGSDANTTIL